MIGSDSLDFLRKEREREAVRAVSSSDLIRVEFSWRTETRYLFAGAPKNGGWRNGAEKTPRCT